MLVSLSSATARVGRSLDAEQAVPEPVDEAEATRPWLRVARDFVQQRHVGAPEFRLARGPLVIRLADRSLRVRSWADDCWSERTLAPLANRFLFVLCECAVDEADTPGGVRGCLSAKALAKKLRFRSRYADEDNVRQVARRVRAVLAELDADHVIAVAPRRGYYLNCAVDRD